ncbi:MAG: glycosyl hydrolase 115 family protein, partial [candidate division KSB1 bacterium]|nr:glycosyl hydrolase 115 family protein [candidate division KSB1 bacterium]
MMRAHDEWRRYGAGPWNYELNRTRLQEFWREGIRRMGSYESIVTIGMRGDGDEPMSEEANIALLQRIVHDQRQILREVTGRDPATIPQVWALYKEVQEYYDKGMRVPDDVTLLLCDDNWGNIRRLPKPGDPPRPGGYGIYYHYDYVGGPRNYKWLNTNQVARVWEQMHLAYEHGVRQIWIVNVGDIKPMEFPIEFFLDYAWDPERITAQDLPAYVQRWAEEQFGPLHAPETAELLTTYTSYNSRRKPELLSPTTYSLINFREAERVVADYAALEKRARNVYEALAPEYQDAFYQLVLHPIEACANLNALYVAVGQNRLYAAQGRAATNALAQKARELFRRDAEITHYYNKVLAGGKWSHMMDQTHIGYTSWQQPDENIMPEVVEIPLQNKAEMGVAIEGSEQWWPGTAEQAILPEFDPFHEQSYYIEVFNRGLKPFRFSASPGERWVRVAPEKGTVATQLRLWVSVDWKKAPMGKHLVPIVVAGPQEKVTVLAPVNNPAQPRPETVRGFVESNGYVAIEAAHYAEAVTRNGVGWERIPDLGRTLSAITPFPVTAPPEEPGGESPRVEYPLFLFSSGEVRVKAYLSPTLDYYGTGGLRYGVSFDEEPVQIVNMHEGRTFQDWEESVRNNVTVTTSRHLVARPGEHVLKLWVVDPGVVVQRLIVETGRVAQSYLGPPESFHGFVPHP